MQTLRDPAVSGWCKTWIWPGKSGNRRNTGRFSPDGRQLYASVRRSDQLVVFPVDGQGRVAGRCDVASGGKGPRHFSLSPDGRFLAVANLASDDVRLFERDADGMLRAVACVDVPQPACVIWDA